MVEQARKDYDNGYYQDKLTEGLEFQDTVTRALYQQGIVIVGYASYRYQLSEGENMLGAEIKRDGLFRCTGNLYIEVAEKAHPDRQLFVPAGIRRNDNSWLFIIGDEKTIWIFANKYLRFLEKRYKRVEKATSLGFLLPLEDADHYCLKRIDLEAEA